MVQRAYNFRIYPTEAQKRQLKIEFGNARFIWNWALDMRIKAYKRRGETLNNVPIGKILTQLKASTRYSWLQEGSLTCYTQKLRDLDNAYRNFFSGKARFPSFKKKFSRQSVRYQLQVRDIHNLYLPGLRLAIPKIGAVKVKWSRIPKGTPKMVTISLDPAGRYFVSMCVEEPVAQLPPATSYIGIDVGVADIATTSDGWKSGAPKYYRTYELKLAREQRKLNRKKKGSKRREMQRQKVAKVHAKIVDSRNDFLHKLSTKLINENQVICLEDLNIRGMVRNRFLSKSISDASMYELRRQLEYKAEWYGRQIEFIDRWTPTSKTCSSCGHKLDEMSLSVREWVCPKCKTAHDRDINAAINVLNTVRRTGINAQGEQLSRGA